MNNSNPSIAQANLSTLNIVLGTIADAYAALSQLYYLPKRTSKAISKKYLMQVMLADSRVLRVSKTIEKHFIEYQGDTCPDMLEKLEAFLAEKNLPPTGFDFLSLPDYQWLYDVCCWVDPENTMGIKKMRIISEAPLTRNVSQE